MSETIDFKIIVGFGDFQLVEKNVRHDRIKMLPSVEEDFFKSSLRQRTADWRGLDELRPRADDGKDFAGC